MFGIDWNRNGKEDAFDLFMDLELLEEMENEEAEGSPSDEEE